jgi:uncharacterized cupin superfamily protein
VSPIFINYRREDTSSQAGRVYDWLGDHYGTEAVFKDIDSIDPGRLGGRRHRPDRAGVAHPAEGERGERRLRAL